MDSQMMAQQECELLEQWEAELEWLAGLDQINRLANLLTSIPDDGIVAYH
jgi:hypothetical protein